MQVDDRRPLALALAALLVIGGIIALVVDGCAKDVRIYSSLPLNGAQGKQVEDMNHAMELALKLSGGKAGDDFDVEYVPLDDSTPEAAGYTDAAVAKNASKAANDDRAVGYIGDLDSGATETSIPILSHAKIAQISPASTAVGLTSKGASADPGEPGTHYHRELSQLRPRRPEGLSPGGGARHRDDRRRLPRARDDQRRGCVRPAARPRHAPLRR